MGDLGRGSSCYREGFRRDLEADPVAQDYLKWTGLQKDSYKSAKLRRDMKRLFLASEARNVLDRFVELFQLNPNELTVGFIPTAADVYSDRSFVEEDRDKLLELGFKVTEISISGRSEEGLREELEEVDIIFVAGGNTFYLLEKAINSGFYNIARDMVENGKYYVGSSAGSVLAGTTIEHAKDMDNTEEAPGLESFEGLKLVDRVILPHYKSEKYRETIDRILNRHSSLQDKMVKLTDNQALAVRGKKKETISSSDQSSG